MKQEILTLLSPQYPWGETLSYYDSIGSTNDELKRLAKAGAPEGTVLIAGMQTNGHGRMGRSFQSPENVGVYLSLLLRPDCPAAELMHLTCAVAVAMCEAVEAAAGFRPQIKWTNDLVFQKKKLGGILTELGLSPNGRVDYAILGIGINCNQKAGEFSPEIRDMAASLAMVCGKEISRARLAAAMLDALHRMNQGLFCEKEDIMATYRRNCITLGKEISILQGDRVRHGLALDIDGDGGLLVRFPEGHEEIVSSGEASVRGMYHYL